jgi:excinuclease UvrABC nuclease subunit
MEKASKENRFEEAAEWRNKVFALEHIQDVAVLRRDDEEEFVETKGDGTMPPSAESKIFGRIEGYDISHVSGTSTVASMVVFERGAPAKAEYRKFRIRWVEGANDVASMQEVLYRRFTHPEWRKPNLLLIDGGLPQVHAVEQVLQAIHLSIPIVGIAKGPERKRNDIIITTTDEALRLACEKHHQILEAVRDEAHRFAITFHRDLRSRRFLGKTK